MSSLPTFKLPIDRVLIGTQALWNAEAKWHDRDGLPIPATPKLVIGMRTIARRWVEKKHIDVTEHPFDIDALNAEIPKPWPTGLNGQEEPPWAQHYVVYFCDPQTGSLYTFVNKTYGSKLAYEQLEERIAVVRALRGVNVVPVVMLGQLPMKIVKYGMRSRPHFEVLEWKVLGGDGDYGAGLVPQSPTPQLGGPTGAAVPAPNPAPNTAPAPASASAPMPAPETKPASALEQMKSAAPLALGEMINDELPSFA